MQQPATTGQPSPDQQAQARTLHLATRNVGGLLSQVMAKSPRKLELYNLQPNADIVILTKTKLGHQHDPVFPGLGARSAMCWCRGASIVCAPVVVSHSRGGWGLGAGFCVSPFFSYTYSRMFLALFCEFGDCFACFWGAPVCPCFPRRAGALGFWWPVRWSLAFCLCVACQCGAAPSPSSSHHTPHIVTHRTLSPTTPCQSPFMATCPTTRSARGACLIGPPASGARLG